MRTRCAHNPGLVSVGSKARIGARDIVGDNGIAALAGQFALGVLDNVIGLGRKSDYAPLALLARELGQNIDRFDKLETAAAEITRAGNCSVFCYRDIAVPDYGNLEIYPKGVSKAATAQLIIDRINPWEVVAFGDNLNDLPLFNLADRRYAPANATEEIKRQATAIIPDNDHDGVARFLCEDFL